MVRPRSAAACCASSPSRSRSSSTSSTSASAPTSTRPTSSSSIRSSRRRWRDDGLRQAAAVNPGDKFELVFKNLLEPLFVERMDQNEEIFVRFMNDVPFQKIVTAWMAAEAYRRLRAEPWRRRRVAACRQDCGWSREAEDRYVKCVPLVPLKAAAGAFGDPQHIDDDGFEWVAVDARPRPAPGHVRRAGRRASMEPAIRTARTASFRAPVDGIAARQDRARPASRRHRPRDRRALHREALRE